jgi:hypothetical protein
MNPLLSELTALPPIPSWQKPESPSAPKPRKQLSDSSIARFREAMKGKGWFLRRDLEPLLGLTRPQLNHAFTRCLVPLGLVEVKWVSKLACMYRWKEESPHA